MKYQEIISQFQQDLRTGVALLYRCYGPQLYSYGIDQWRLDEDASYDVLYKTLETVGRVITRYEFTSESHFRNWLFKIHKNNILQILRSQKSKELPTVSMQDWIAEAKEDEDDFSLEEFADVIESISTSGPHNNASAQSQLMFAMQKALLLLSDTERELLLLRMNNYSYNEIAEMIGIPNNQLKVKFNRAKARVKKKTLEILKDCLS
ncbi:sigma-70 family RNA polymerase sigma factor [Paraflavitalea sp. CAU 1676]|uniref:RNA polymerase sigma factor n=1 Tax=Paraflavitalea sp. CAU 1676 TaxID=3032598 RepID=UPI0023D9F172|nr:sigma-70 family RNA polymerase sigma factor [Paraflavitalea sp. CAU 1676]MDF2188328.1 sigma-70 family RNA polymerase sigma factor [Paraflavitalea sp. CAU 1676]